MDAILKGIRVIDLTQGQLGPVANQILADMGAEVIKVERLEGEMGRRFAPYNSNGRSAYFQCFNRNKKSVAINLKHPKGIEALYKLVKNADVFSENFQRGVADKLGLGYEALAKINPGIVYFSGSGFGLKGPMSKHLGYDGVGQAMGGIVSTIPSPAGQAPPVLGVPVCDQTAGFLGCLGIVLALFHKQRTGEGQQVDVSLLSAGIGLTNWVLQAYLFTGYQYRAKTRARVTPIALSGTFLPKDGKPLLIQLVSDDRIEACLKVLGLEDALKDPRFKLKNLEKYAEEILAILDDAFRKKNREEWLRSFAEVGVTSAPVLNLQEISEHPQVLENEYVVEIEDPKGGTMKVLGSPIRFSKTPAKIGVSPELGAHTDSILADAGGYSQAEIAELRKIGAIG
jgi:crotonobetainyl-CoA:carnitine CoA-transferase CaiB-like acyl-CoA transferase